jgi:hypothetical protein
MLQFKENPTNWIRIWLHDGFNVEMNHKYGTILYCGNVTPFDKNSAAVIKDTKIRKWVNRRTFVVYQIFLQIAIISAKWISNDCWLKIGVSCSHVHYYLYKHIQDDVLFVSDEYS